MDEQHRAHTEAVLHERRKTLADQLEALERPPEAAFQTIGFGKRAGDATAAAADRLNDAALAHVLEAALRDAEEALRAIQVGEYSICVRCVTQILLERMVVTGPGHCRCMPHVKITATSRRLLVCPTPVGASAGSIRTPTPRPKTPGE